MNACTIYSLTVILIMLPVALYAQMDNDMTADYGEIEQELTSTMSRFEQDDADFIFYKDPFESYLPKPAEGEGGAIAAKEGDLGPPPVTIEGILWGTEKPLVIIDGEVYGVGDMLLTVDAKVFKIKDNVVFLSYGERIYEMNVKAKGVQ